MIQDFSLNIKSAFNSFDSFDFKFFDEPDFDTVERIETYCLNYINVFLHWIVGKVQTLFCYHHLLSSRNLSYDKHLAVILFE